MVFSAVVNKLRWSSACRDVFEFFPSMLIHFNFCPALIFSQRKNHPPPPPPYLNLPLQPPWAANRRLNRDADAPHPTSCIFWHLHDACPHLCRGDTKVNSNITALASLYCNDCSQLSTNLSKTSHILLSTKQELYNYMNRSSRSHTHRKVHRGENKCFGCANSFISQALELFMFLTSFTTPSDPAASPQSPVAPTPSDAAAAPAATAPATVADASKAGAEAAGKAAGNEAGAGASEEVKEPSGPQTITRPCYEVCLHRRLVSPLIPCPLPPHPPPPFHPLYPASGPMNCGLLGSARRLVVQVEDPPTTVRG